MSEIGALSVRIGADTTDLKKGLNEAERSVNSFEDSVSKLKKVIGGLAILTVLNEIAQFTKGVVDAADALGDLSERTGISVDQLSRLQYAAQISDVSLGELQGSLNALTRNMSAASMGTGEADQAFKLLGVTYKNANGSLKDSYEVLLDLADVFSGLEDGPNKNALAFAIFGKSAATLIPLLNQGRDGITGLGKELDRLGATVTPEASKAAGEFNDNLDKLKLATQGLAMAMANELLPVLNKYLEQIVIATKNSLTFFDKLELGIRSPFKSYQELIKDIDKELAGFTGQETNRIAELRKASLMRQKAYYEELLQITKLKNAEKDLANEQTKKDSGKKKAPVLTAGLKQERDVMNEHVIAYLEMQEKIRQEQERYRERLSQQAESVRQGLLDERTAIIEDEAEKRKILDEANAMGLIADEAHAQARIDLEQQTQDRLNEIRKRSMTELEKFQQMSYGNQVKTVAQSLIQMTQSVTRESRAMFNINKAASIANAIVSTYEGINKALSAYPPPISFAMAAAQAAAGFANVRAIASQQFGSSTAAPSVSAATPVGATAVSPVAAGGGGGGGGAGQMVTINLTGEIFGREQVRGLIGQINEAISDGAVLRLQ